jgi:hypothetical protein
MNYTYMQLKDEFIVDVISLSDQYINYDEDVDGEDKTSYAEALLELVTNFRKKRNELIRDDISLEL